MAIHVSIVEDNDRVRESLASLIDGAKGFRCAGAYCTAETALRLIPREKPDVVLMDIHLGQIGGIECVRKLKALDPEQLVVMLTAYEDDDLIFQALKAGANGYLLKQSTPADLLAAIKEVHEGGAPMSSNIARKVIQSFHQNKPTGSRMENLSPREREILMHGSGCQILAPWETLDRPTATRLDTRQYVAPIIHCTASKTPSHR